LKLIIHAPNIHTGGGRTLLLALLESIEEPVIVQIDQRLEMSTDLEPGFEIIRVTPNVITRLRAELRLRYLCGDGDTVLCFGNLPPLFRCPGRVFVYLQNRYLIEPRDISGLPWKARLRILVERLWLRYLRRGAVLLVQTETMKEEVRRHLGCDAKVMPIFPETFAVQTRQSDVDYDYVYLASGEPHKNHLRLLEAWVLLAKQGIRPSLHLTLDTLREAALCSEIERLVHKYDLRITNQYCSAKDIGSLLARCGALIYPSIFESFGLPLLEARVAGLPIVAAERDYVRDVVNPVVTFDPESAMSIQRAVLRHLGHETEPPIPGDASQFLDKLAE
jgi:glycosyltransferase involved in cell wall biosynthesis